MDRRQKASPDNDGISLWVLLQARVVGYFDGSFPFLL